jgi:hypothetical protein
MRIANPFRGSGLLALRPRLAQVPLAGHLQLALVSFLPTAPVREQREDSLTQAKGLPKGNCHIGIYVSRHIPTPDA